MNTVSTVGTVGTARRATLAALAVVLVGEAVLLRVAISHTFYDHHVMAYEFGAGGAFLVALVLLWRSGVGAAATSRVGGLVVIGVGAVLQILMVTRPPADSDDDFRYLWDAKVQLAGIDPYRYPPSSAALAQVRDGYLFPAGPCGQHSFAGGCTRINLPDAHTIYPPIAEGMFTLIRLLSFGGHGQQLPLQLAAALGTVVISWLLARFALDRGLPLWTVALWAWCPVPAMEFSNNAHIDWLAVLFSVLALMAASRGRPLLAAIALGAGIATKLYPGLIGASLLRRRPWAVIATSAGVVALVYLPHVIAVGGGVLGYLPDYLQTGGYGSGHQYRLLVWVLPHVLVTPVAALIVAGVIVWAVLRGDADHPERSALVVVGVAILVSTPTLPWYMMLLLALAVMNARPEWIGVVFAPTVEYLLVGAYGVGLDQATSLSYLGGLVVLLAGTWLRRSAAHRLPRPRVRPDLDPVAG